MATILVVDDEPTIRALIRNALEEAGHQILEAADGLGGLELARSERPDLILLDVVLPKLSGSEVSQRLREDPRTADCPILVLSGIESEAEPLGVAGRIEKPFRPQALVAGVAEALALAS